SSDLGLWSRLGARLRSRFRTGFRAGLRPDLRLRTVVLLLRTRVVVGPVEGRDAGSVVGPVHVGVWTVGVGNGPHIVFRSNGIRPIGVRVGPDVVFRAIGVWPIRIRPRI